jgi:hypothetical protein
MLNETTVSEASRRAKVRRNSILLGLVALSFYVAFIAMSVARS